MQARQEVNIPSDANIGTITRLARQLKIAQMERDLREAQKAVAPASAQQVPAFGSSTSTPAAPVARPPAASLPPPHPAIAQIGGMGGVLHAYLADGREAQVGMRLTLGDQSSWTVRGVRPTYVVFDVCPGPAQARRPAPKPARRDAASQDQVPACQITNVEPLMF